MATWWFPSIDGRRAISPPTASTKYTPSAITPDFTTRALGDSRSVQQGFEMDRARIHEGVRRMRFEDILGRSELSQMEAAELLGISERTFRRWRDRHRESGLAGLDDRRLAPSLRRAPVAEIERMLGLYRDLYRGFTVQHFHEQLLIRPGSSWRMRMTAHVAHHEAHRHAAFDAIRSGGASASGGWVT